MPKHTYKTGDAVTLKSRNLGNLAAQQHAKIIAVLPETQGSPRFRIRLDGENFDRSVSHDDIFPVATTSGNTNVATGRSTKTGGWINHDLVRMKK